MFDERNLRFHHLTHQPLLNHKQFLIISPELILDSLFTNIHYTLIEAPAIKNEYIKRQASMFLNKIVVIAEKFGYFEVDREKDLYEGKNQIGDIDLILKNADNHYLLIEAKNHALKMDIYFKDTLKTKDHLQYLQKEWEQKVKRRVNHLKASHINYSISDNYSYIVVSRYPEIISHFSDLFVVSVHEFEIWLEKYNSITVFSEFYNKYYDMVLPNYTIDELEALQKSNIFFGRFSKE